MFNPVVWYLSSVVVSYLMKVGILGVGIMGSQIAIFMAITPVSNKHNNGKMQIVLCFSGY
jgi:hypothetical protein